MFQRAIVRPPGPSLVAGLSAAGLGLPDPTLAVAQHGAYCDALAALGLRVIRLPVDDQHPDSTFVEDTAIVTERGALLTRPGAESRLGEVAAIAPTLVSLYGSLATIEAPGTLDGGDICDADGHFLIGLSARTNEEGARQLATWLDSLGWTSEVVDARPIPALLHLKTGISYLGDGRMAVIRELAGHPALARWEQIVVDDEEAYAANCVRIDGPAGSAVLVADGYPRFAAALARLGLAVVPLAMSEFRRVDGGLSCLSLRC